MKLLSSLVLAVSFAACSRSEPPAPAPAPAPTSAASTARDPKAARELIAQGAVVIDVRGPDEYAEGHLPAAVNIPVDEISGRLAEVATLASNDKARPIVVYCGAGPRAAKAKTLLVGAGYSRVVNGGGLGDLR